RHRASIGMSENSDAVVVVVSEETGNISVAIDGKLRRDFNMGSLHEFLEKELIVKTDDNDNSFISKIKMIGGNRNDSSK
ncbi:MAG: DNA integrity scanning protein DisA nucleotide-binding domain protein, partial [Clostridia bacterium]|nr:DNA integrity scanning protein DisA nucleotide-binding domain protein [Clostridia bacterium]